MPDLVEDHVFCHLFLAHAADGQLDDEEIMAVRAGLRPVARRLGHSEADVDDLVTAGIDAYWEILGVQGPGAVTARYREGIARLLSAVGDTDGADTLFTTLAQVAAADGLTDDMEALLIDAAVEQWEGQLA